MDRDERLTPLREVSADGRALLTDGAGQGTVHAAGNRADLGPNLLEVSGLRKSYQTRRAGWLSGPAKSILAVDDVSFQVARGRTFGLVGESGCGKTTVSKMIMRALSPDAGTVTFDGAEGQVDVLAIGRQRAGAFPAPPPVHLPGPVPLAQPAHDGLRHRRRAAGDPRHRQRGRADRAGQGAAGRGRPRRPPPRAAIRTASPAASGSASASPARWRSAPRC